MSENVGILESNSFSMKNIGELDPSMQELVRRRSVLGPCYRLFYQRPLHLVRGVGSHVFDADGTDYLDAYNNIPSVGHCNQRVVDAVTHQMSTLNTHTRYVHENILDYAEDLLSTMPDELDNIMFMCSGSEANDLAVRLAQFISGGEGIIVTKEAYHGNTALISGLSPSIGPNVPMSPTMRMIPTPDTYRLETGDIGGWMCDRISEQISDMRRHGIKFAGVLFDGIFSSDGVFPDDAGFLKPVVDLVHREGGLYIADEVQPGFCRTGDAFWGFQRHGIVPDMVTMGKPMANGIPCSGMAVKHQIIDEYARLYPYFNTFAGSPVAMAAAQATLAELREKNLLQHAHDTGAHLKQAIVEASAASGRIGDVRGAGFFIGAEVVVPGATRPDRLTAVKLVELMREHHVLVSLCGPFGNVLKVRPPLVFSEDDVDIFANALERSLNEL
ncbi:4-aminobutyrate aminotransferase [Tractidigestivibacter scatoligenes]|uniref:4-aminobutyrate aminotransferase n=1 Tax=Tractidigestivibacter scatoligenes TaxID=1299998 RepID=A0A100YX14_TRASO|nr:aspartate aminotransferase family protein [Tractidigestivibacter scatoligenes]KUH58997.1 4-aminobutyrate aminotransferase [Tractidigestivibacter scatoligenes]